MNLNYIIVYVNDLPKMKAFYIDKLGMTNLGSVSSDIFATLRPSNGGAMVGLQDKKSSQLPPGRETQPGSVELSFEVEDVDATHKQWKKNGVEIIAEPTDLPFGRYMLAKDPEGHYLSAFRFANRS
jgi:predicted enzyme related to lactoylglutathione lyase